MEPLVILSRTEQEYLLRAIESGLRVASLRQMFLWTQGQVQALLPHDVLVCVQFGTGGAVLRLDCMHGTVLAPARHGVLADRRDGLAVRIARHCLLGGQLPAWSAAGADDAAQQPDLPGFRAEIAQAGFANVLVHGTGPTAAGASIFLLFGLPMAPTARHAYFMELLLAHLHLALGRLPPARDPDGAAPARALSARETEIVGWLRAGKSNDEMGHLLGISALTVKNHLQRIYRTLGVGNRAHALARCMELRLLDQNCAPSARRIAS